VSALLGRIPSAVGYQPTLATDMGALQERITTTHKGSITSVQAIYVAGDDLTDPAPATSFAHLDATTVLSRAISEKGIYPAGIRSTPLAHAVAADCRRRALTRPRAWSSRCCSRYKSLQDIIAILGMGRTLRRGQDRGGPCPQDRALPVAAVLRRRSLHGSPGKFVDLADTIRAFAPICEGKYDHLPESAFYMVGTIEEAVEKGKKLAAEAA